MAALVYFLKEDSEIDCASSLFLLKKEKDIAGGVLVFL